MKERDRILRGSDHAMTCPVIESAAAEDAALIVQINDISFVEN
jgi:hypothetical protein